ncbi:dTDP-4-amino-4,6-dideoxygalactose transaminase [Sphingomonas gellani]|uniref:dTDP-4-amino-4,6-dideoxygalactose transaminase n=1 Tax=Sphingomonas gellani TaxID=1166340 RepID=A0A1H8DQ63_9SPHN|nr:DegT/DnrJ/EryC1/StrS family aminotransferase [Sphingomonas gellani]SEN08698.1 dTDP-4-amino-4,6-dideoxygalactose transaminase [Sphingomonas gellani]
MHPLPLIAPNPPRLSEHADALRRLEASGVFSNNGPEVQAFESEVTDALFDGMGATLAVANATLGLMIALREAVGPATPPPGTLALMPALTFAATAQAAIWAGLTPLICDIDPDDWSASAAAEDALLSRYGDRIGAIVPYATFGNAIDLDRYIALNQRRGVGVVVDAASSLGTRDDAGVGFGAASPFATVYSMHATKTFAVAEGGLIHCGNPDRIARLRAMASFGFEQCRIASLPGLNAKLPEVLALMARLKLAEIGTVCERRAALESAYRGALDGFQLQRVAGRSRASQFMPVVLPPHLALHRDAIAAMLADRQIGCGRYFSPHLGQQPLFQQTALIEPTPVADRIADAMLSLPLTDTMSVDDVARVTDALNHACRAVDARSVPVAPVATSRAIANVVVIGGGPAGSAILLAAGTKGLLPSLASGLVMVERDEAIGGGQLGRYAITSDTTADTFLSAVRGSTHPQIVALADHPAARAVAQHSGALGVPLTEVGPLLRETGRRLTTLIRDHGGTVLTGHEALGATRRADGLWSVRLRRLSDGAEVEQIARNLVIAAGGHQPLDRLSTQVVAGGRLIDMAGGRLLQSDEVLSVGGFEKVADLLAGRRAPRVAVIGGSTSAAATLFSLLKGRPAIPFGAGALTLLHREPLRPFFPSVAAAAADGFSDFGPDDICPVSGFVYRLAGFRLEARELMLRMLGVDGRQPDPRVTLHRIRGDDDADAREIMERADLVIAALGYRPVGLPLSDAAGNAIALAAHGGAPMVDRHCRVMGDDGEPVPGLYGIGLAAGFVPWGHLGGEKSFRGQANGLWLWQNDVGLMIVQQLLGEAQQVAA